LKIYINHIQIYIIFVLEINKIVFKLILSTAIMFS